MKYLKRRYTKTKFQHAKEDMKETITNVGFREETRMMVGRTYDYVIDERCEKCSWHGPILGVSRKGRKLKIESHQIRSLRTSLCAFDVVAFLFLDKQIKF